ncbi:MAG: hypothetical protein IIY55_05720 [Blautia sp.]|nr:hypothetical protein [Blautia sp.]
MKKALAAALGLSLVMSSLPAYAGDLSVVMIGEETAADTVSLDDIKLGTVYPIDGYASIMPIEFFYYDFFAQFGESGDYSAVNRGGWNMDVVASYSDSHMSSDSWRFTDAGWMESGDNAQFAWLAMDITNLQKTPVDFIEEISVKVTYKEEYEFIGWIRQIDTDLIDKSTSDRGVRRSVGNPEDYPNTIVLNPGKTHDIDMLYTGHYIIGCTLPNYVVSDTKSPLYLEINLGGNELTYKINK